MLKGHFAQTEARSISARNSGRRPNLVVSSILLTLQAYARPCATGELPWEATGIPTTSNTFSSFCVGKRTAFSSIRCLFSSLNICSFSPSRCGLGDRYHHCVPRCPLGDVFAAVPILHLPSSPPSLLPPHLPSSPIVPPSSPGEAFRGRVKRSEAIAKIRKRSEAIAYKSWHKNKNLRSKK